MAKKKQSESVALSMWWVSVKNALLKSPRWI
jgi:hypothetical protein